MASLPSLFDSPQEIIITTQQWYSLLSQNQGAYDDCVVRALTHVKNLRSKVTHEYLQVIVEKVEAGVEESKPKRTRLLAERQNPQDQVIIGRRNWGATSSSGSSSWLTSSSSSSSSGGRVGDLPLPLFSLEFNSDVLKVRDLVRLLKLATDEGGKYSFLNHNCYWFARNVYDAVKLKFSCVEKRWRWRSWRGLPILRTARMKPDAESFVKDREDNFNYAPGVADALQVWLGAIYADAADLSVDDQADLKAVKPESSIRAMLETSRKILEQNNDGEYQDTFREFDMRKQVEVVVDGKESSLPPLPSCIQVQEPTEAEQQTIDRAAQILVGSILKRFTKEPEFM
ncbi:hypothetical protein OQA88_1179 [Cercophora sp. LCS_1]